MKTSFPVIRTLLPRRPRPFGAHTISSSDGTYLRFDSQEDLDHYKSDIHEARMRAYHRQREKHGVWAGNQGKFVSSLSEFNQWDSRHMEDLYAQWSAK